MSALEMASNCTCQTARLAKPLGNLQSPMAELLSTSAALSPAECTVVREKILQIAVDISELDSEIGRVEQILERLRQNRVVLRKRSDDGHRSVLNVTHRLPVEILAEIFVQLQGMQGGRSITPTRVCRHWREVAIGTPRLWSHLVIQYRRKHTIQEMIPIWLQRSGGQPLNIVLGRIHPDYVENETEHPAPAALDTLLYNQAHRWKDVKFIITKSMASFLRNLPSLPMLQSLHIDTSAPDVFSSLDDFPNAPALRVLTLDKRVIYHYRYPPILPKFPWAQLTKCTLLRGGDYTCRDGYRILKEAVNLQHFTMEVNTTSRTSILLIPPLAGIHLASLLSLEFCVVAGVAMLDFLDVLTLSALTELKVIDMESKAVESADHVLECVAALITRSGCPLQRLSLGNCRDEFTHDTILELFKIIPMLSELEIHFRSSGSRGDDSMMDLLTHKPYHAAGLCCLLPRLASIKLAVHATFSYEIFADLLSSRHRAGACNVGGGGLVQLREAALITWHDISASGRRARCLPWETFEKFTELGNSGLDLYVIDGGARLSLGDYFSPGEEEDDSQSEDEDSQSEDEDD